LPTAVALEAVADEAEPHAKEAVPAFSTQPAAVTGGGTLCARTPSVSVTASAAAAAAPSITRRTPARICLMDEN
jgi:hypothetical protein